MIKSVIKAFLPVELGQVWEIVTKLDEQTWRSDISSVIIGDDGKCFDEISKNGFRTKYKINEFEPNVRYGFDIENDNLIGNWTGFFSEKDNGCVIEFTECITPKKWYMKALVKQYLKKQQKNYIKDLKKALNIAL